MKHLLLICYFYPPDGGAGTQRPLSIARHAAVCGWRVTVLTRESTHQRGAWDPADPTLCSSFEHVREVRIAETEESNAKDMITREDGDQDPWLIALTHKSVELNQSDPFDHILVTMPPYGMASLPKMLKDACPRVPVSIDLRDPWAFDGAFAYNSKAMWRKNIAAMRRTLNTADGIVVNTPEVRTKIEQIFPEVDSNRMTVVTNGFEPDLFDSSMPDQPEAYEGGFIHLVHVGTLHSGAVMRYRGLKGWLRQLKHYRAEPADISGRTAVPIMNAIGKLNQAGLAGHEKLRLILVGPDDPPTRQLAESSGCAEQVLMTGYMAHDQAVAWLRWAQCLFLPLHGLPDGHRSLIAPGKTYEYLASQRPILGAVPQGDAQQFLRESGRALIAPACDVDQIAERLAEVIDWYQKGTTPTGQPADWASRFSRQTLTRSLCVFLEQIGHKHHVAG
ncbi:MAG: glycosyltransferase [Planctomycetota bacterium]